MGVPVIFNGSRTKLLTSAGFLLQSGITIDYDGLVNYISNSNAEINTTGWSTYANTAANIPSNGTGGSATGLTFASTTSSPLDQTASFLMTQANSTSLQGKGVSYDFTINSADQAHVLNILFDFNASSTFVASNGTTAPLNDGTTTTNAGNSDVEVFIYDKTNAVLIYVSPEVLTANGTNNFKFAGTFQTASNSTSYRLIFHVATTSANATGWTLKFDNVFVGRQPISLGAPVTDWNTNLSFTPSASFGTIASSTYYTRFSGDTMEVVGLFTAGTVTGAVASLSMPAGFTMDSTKLPSSASGTPLGYYSFMQSGTTAIFSSSATVFYDGSDTAKVYFASQTSGGTFTKNNANSVGNTGAVQQFYFKIPITGRSSSTLLSNNASTRVVVAIITGDPASASSGNPIIVPTITYDSHGAYNATTGRYTVPVSGQYKFYGALQSASAATTLTIYKNASSTSLAGNLDSNGEATYCSSVNCVAGDLIDLRPGGTVDATNMTMTIEMLTGPSQIAVVDAVNARYFASATSISSSLATVSWTTKDYDSHNGMSAGTYTVPTSGKYQVNSALLVTGTIALNNTIILEIQKNGTVVSRNTLFAGGIMTDLKGNISDQIACVAGDTLRIQVSTTATGPSIVSSNFDNYISLFRTGN